MWAVENGLVRRKAHHILWALPPQMLYFFVVFRGSGGGHPAAEAACGQTGCHIGELILLSRHKISPT